MLETDKKFAFALSARLPAGPANTAAESQLSSSA